MESWCYVSGGNAVVSNETIPTCDTFARSKNASMGWDFKTPFSSFGNNLLVSDHQAIDNQGLDELGFQELLGKQVPGNSIRGNLDSKVYGGKIINPFMLTPNASFIDDESTSRLSSSVVDSNYRGSSCIDLKLGRVGDPTDAQNSRICQGTPILSPSKSSIPPKRVRMGVNFLAAYCQVYGCNKDLSSSKEYHKRHKVCEVHSKTAKVTVNGMEQRFCQQCSRFHLLAEFDDGKRSCRKRLAGHNQRRRKPQVGIHAGRTAALLRSYNGISNGRLQGTATLTTSFICQDILPGGLLHTEKYGANDWSKHIKVEDGTDLSPPLTVPFAREHLHSRPIFPSNNFEKLLRTFHDSGANSPTGRAFSENTDRYPPDFGGPNSGSLSLLQDNTLGNEEFSAFDSATTIQGLSGITDSGCALSLLSCQSPSSSSPSSRNPLTNQLLVPRSNSHYSLGHVSGRLMGVNSQACTSGMSNRFSSSGGHPDSILISESTDADFDITGEIYQGSQFSNGKDCLSCGDDTTINLLQLSSQLQRVEHQKQSMLVKQENDAFYYSRIT